MTKRLRNSLILAKNEVTPGVDPTPTGAANAILIRNMTLSPLQGDTVSRDLIRPYLGNSEQLLAGVHNRLEFEVELAGSGTAGDAPGWGPVLRSCGFAETVTAGTDVKYAPITDDVETITFYVLIDGLFHKMTGALGTVQFDISAKAIPFMKFAFVGAYHDVVDQALPPNIDYTKFLTPLVASKQNTPAWSLHGKSNCLQSLQIDMANSTPWRSLIGCEGTDLTDRKPTGSVSMELGAVAEKDWWKAILDGTSAPLSITHGKTAGNIVKLDAPKAQLTNIQYADQEGVLMMNSQLTINPNIGNDELVITVK